MQALAAHVDARAQRIERTFVFWDFDNFAGKSPGCSFAAQASNIGTFLQGLGLPTPCRWTLAYNVHSARRHRAQLLALQATLRTKSVCELCETSDRKESADVALLAAMHAVHLQSAQAATAAYVLITCDNGFATDLAYLGQQGAFTINIGPYSRVRSRLPHHPDPYDLCYAKLARSAVLAVALEQDELCAVWRPAAAAAVSADDTQFFKLNEGKSMLSREGSLTKQASAASLYARQASMRLEGDL